MSYVYTHINITYYTHSAPEATISWLTDEDGLIRRELAFDKALKAQWELVKAGGKRSYQSNYLAPELHTVDVILSVRH